MVQQQAITDAIKTLADKANFYDPPFKTRGEASVEIVLDAFDYNLF